MAGGRGEENKDRKKYVEIKLILWVVSIFLVLFLSINTYYIHNNKKTFIEIHLNNRMNTRAGGRFGLASEK